MNARLEAVRNIGKRTRRVSESDQIKDSSSWKGEALDLKLPLLRSEENLNSAMIKLLNLCGVSADSVYSTLGIEQEYFLIDRSLFLLRPDLLLGGRTVFGTQPPKELEDRYFGNVNDRVMAYMEEFENAAIRLGILVKTRHNKLAPAQYEVSPFFEKASIAVDHNLQLIELMRQIALKHDLACLFHEKPFMGIDGSNKQNNWSLSTDTGLNLLDPKGDSLVFLILLTAILSGISEHAPLLEASIASAGNDHRLKDSELLYLGQALEQLVETIVHGKKEDLHLKTIVLSDLDGADRNHSSFFAFTGNQFAFRAVGASANPALPALVIHAIVTDSLLLILEKIGSIIKDRTLTEEALFQAVLPVLRKSLREALPTFGVYKMRKSVHAFKEFIDKKSIRIFEGILTEEELYTRYEIILEQYVKTMNCEANLMIELFQTQILPAVQMKTSLIENGIQAVEEIKKMQSQISDFGTEAKAKVFCELIEPKMEELRGFVDQLEMVVDDTLWPLPKYRELLYFI